jgi:hypothetical protein
MNKDVKRLMSRLVDQGFTYNLTKQGRLLVRQGSTKVASIPTETGGAAMKKYVAHLERAGFRA